MSQSLIVAYWSIILLLKLNIDKSEEKFQVCSQSIFGISEIFAILNYPNHCTSINNLTVISYNILVYNFTFKVKYQHNRREISSLLTISFPICEIFAILYYLNLDTCIDNVSTIDCSILV